MLHCPLLYVGGFLHFKKGKMKILVCGDRNWDDYGVVDDVINIVNDKYGPIEVIEGGAKGADTCARTTCETRHIEFHEFPANWARYSRGAGPIRNSQMLREEPELVIGFHDNIGQSKGTMDMLNKANVAYHNPGVILVFHDPDVNWDWQWYGGAKEGISLNI